MKKSMAAMGIAGALLVGACGGDSGNEEEIVSFLLEQGESQASAECFAENLKDWDISYFESVETAEGPEDIDEEFFVAVDRVSETVCADIE